MSSGTQYLFFAFWGYKYFGFFFVSDHRVRSLTPAADALYFGVVFVADDDDVVSCKAFFFHDPVDFQNEGAGHIYIRDVFSFSLS